MRWQSKEKGIWHLTLDETTTPQEVFQNIAYRKDVSVERFEIAEPSLDDIFVSIVQDQKFYGAVSA